MILQLNPIVDYDAFTQHKKISDFFPHITRCTIKLITHFYIQFLICIFFQVFYFQYYISLVWFICLTSRSQDHVPTERKFSLQLCRSIVKQADEHSSSDRAHSVGRSHVSSNVFRMLRVLCWTQAQMSAAEQQRPMNKHKHRLELSTALDCNHESVKCVYLFALKLIWIFQFPTIQLLQLMHFTLWRGNSLSSKIIFTTSCFSPIPLVACCWAV